MPPVVVLAGAVATIAVGVRNHCGRGPVEGDPDGAREVLACDGYLCSDRVFRPRPTPGLGCQSLG